MSLKGRKSFNLPLLTILVIAILVRVYGLAFGFPFFLHPDETKIIEPALTMSFGFKNALLSRDLYFFDPQFFFYPSFLIYLMVILVFLLKAIITPLNLLLPSFIVPFSELSKANFYLMARGVSVIFGTATVYLVYLLGEKLSSKKAGLVAAFLLSFTYLHAKNSHYYTGDVAATFFVVSVFYFLFRFLRDKKNKYLYFSGILTGLGVSTKYYPVFVIIPILLGLFLLTETTLSNKIKKSFITLFLAVFSFIVFTPFSVLDWPLFYKDMQRSSARSAAGIFGYTNSNPFYYFVANEPSFHEPFTKNSFLQGLGLPFLLLSIFSIIYFLRSKEKRFYLIMIYLLVHYIFFAGYQAKFVRWLIPLVPFFTLFTGVFLIELTNKIKKSNLWLGALSFLTIFPSFIYLMVFNVSLGRVDTRVQAYEWLLTNIPERSTVVFEYFDIPQFLNKKFNLSELVHPRYNINQAIEIDRPPDFQFFQEKMRPDFIILNHAFGDRFNTPSSKRFYPQASQSWLDFYDKIEENYKLAAQFEPRFPDNIRAGPKISIYEAGE